MWSREDLKARGKFAFQRNYWMAVAVSVIAALLLGELSSKSDAAKNTYSVVRDGSNYSYHLPGLHGSFEFNGPLAVLVGLIIFSIVSIAALIGKLFRIFIGNAVKVGSNRFYMENREHKTGVGTILYAFRSGEYFNVALTMFLMDLFIFLWTLLLVIPGIVKSYEYRMVPYILSENPGMDYHRAFAISRQMMDGQKLDTFILDLSFIGWFILAGLTCNIVGIFYVNPYYDAVNAELYSVFRAHAFHEGRLSMADLPGYSGQAGYGTY